MEASVALVVPTAGSTGTPKAAELDHAALTAAAEASAARLDVRASDRWLCCLPVHHIAGLMVVVRSLLAGAEPVMHPRFDSAAVAAEREATLVSMVPAMLTRLLDEGGDLSRFRVVLLGGGRIPLGLPARAAAGGVRVVATYGATETCGGIVYDGLPLTGAELSIAGDGEVRLRGPMLMRGYRGRPDLTERVLAGGWFHTGDLGEIGADGRLRVHGRRDGMISTGGEKVAPEEVEAILAEHPQVKEAAVCGLPDDRWGQRVVVLVVPAGPTPPSLEELRRHVAARAARHKVPRELMLVADLPRTPSGKLSRPALERLAREGTRL